eukprot:7374899-Pyramimonas_sp.AAC.1
MRASKIRRLRRIGALSKIARPLWSTGAVPQALSGHRVAGLSRQMVLQLRRQAGFMIGGVAKGRCLTTTLGCEPTLQDPAVYIPIQVIKEWITMWQRNPHLRGR